MDIVSVAGNVLFTAAVETVKELVIAAVKAGANLSRATLYGANLSGATLSGADLSGANLSGAILYGATLSGANLYGANLSRATLYGATLYGANLSGATLSRATLSGANLSGATLSGANLYGANLSGANLYGATLYGAILYGATLENLPIASIKVLAGLYRYEVWAVLFQDGSRWIRMGCLWYSLEKWEEIGIRTSNPNEFPDNGSDKCEERVRAFEFARDTVLRMK